MIKIKTSDIKEFLNRTSGIKQNSLLAMCNYVKLEMQDDSAVFAETNLAIYCTHEVPAEGKDGEIFLIEKKQLSALASVTKAQHITITQSGKKIVLSDGLNKPSFLVPDGNFQAFPQRAADAKVTALPKAFLANLSNALPFMDNQDGLDNFIYVSPRPGGGEMFASDRNIGYYRKFDFDLPDLMLTSAQARILAMYDEASHNEAGNYDFFDCGLTTYGFIKTEMSKRNYGALVSKFTGQKKKDLERFIIDQDSILSFANLATRQTSYGYCLFTLTSKFGDDKSVILSFADESSAANEIEIAVDTNFQIQQVNMNAKQTPILMGALDGTNAVFYSFGSTFFIESLEGEDVLLFMQQYDVSTEKKLEPIEPAAK